MYQLRDMHKTTWMHPRSKQWHLIDYIITRQSDLKDVMITRSMRGADGGTDHRLVRAKLNLKIRPPMRRCAPRARLNIRALQDANTRSTFQTELENEFTIDTSSLLTTEDLTRSWDDASNNILAISRRTLGVNKKKSKDWFDDQATDIHKLIAERNKAFTAVLDNPSHAKREKLAEIRSKTQREIRAMKNQWWTKLAHEIQGYADTGNQQEFYTALKTAYGPCRNVSHPVRSADGKTLHTEKSEILARWAEHYRDLLNRHTQTDPNLLNELPNSPTVWELDNPPTLAEVKRSIAGLKNNKASGPDNIPAELLKYGGDTIANHIHAIITAIWETKCVPQQWKDADITNIYKKKGDIAVCGNSRGISLLSAAGKILTRLMLLRLLTDIAEDVLPETQCGFRKERSTTDMLFVARQLQEKCREHHKPLYMVFIDLTKAFDTVNRPLLWNILEKFGCPPTFLAVLTALHDGANARVISAGAKSDPFTVESGVRQGCVIAPIIFNLFLAGVQRTFTHQLPPDAGVPIKYRLDGNMFNLRRLQAKTKVTKEAIIDLQYADDAAYVSCSPDTMQHTLNLIAGTYNRAGLIINTTKTEVLTMRDPPQDPATFSINNEELKNVAHFSYLGSALTETCEITNEVHRRIGLASASFGRLTNRVFQNRDLAIKTKVIVYKAICLSILLYGCEAWVPYRKHIRKLESFHTGCLQHILGIKWWHKIPHTEIRQRANIEPLEILLLQKQLRWAGHVIRMPETRLPRKVMYGEIPDSARSVGGQRKRYKDHLKTSLKSCNIQPQTLEISATDRQQWRVSCHEGTKAYAIQLRNKADAKRAQRHQPPAQEGEVCDICNRICRSRIGLYAHRRTHQN